MTDFSLRKDAPLIVLSKRMTFATMLGCMLLGGIVGAGIGHVLTRDEAEEPSVSCFNGEVVTVETLHTEKSKLTNDRDEGRWYWRSIGTFSKKDGTVVTCLFNNDLLTEVWKPGAKLKITGGTEYTGQ